MPDDDDSARAQPARGDTDRATADPTDTDPTDADRAADHAAIDRLAGTLVPALIAKLGTLNVGELEVREGDWHVRLRRPPGAGISYGRRATDRPSRAHPGHEQHGHAPASPEAHRAMRPAGGTSTAASNGSGGSADPGLAAVGPGRTAGGAAATIGHAATGPTAGDGSRGASPASIATSPAVGVFQPGPRAVAGTRVRAGDRLGVVDMLGVPQEVVAPFDGIVVGVIVDAGTAVEYGQELIHLEPAAPAGAGPAAAGAPP
ncbi:MAG: biotin/lipoyl-containing protein, partial [Chloroflexota bacterium]